ncbi:hypothetical protein [Endozoicomonas sp. 4G]|uniref:hypothetical protein n=1 Tax=Endozoicomonas sp. 4G TaxID=2872754 RepID=UPI002078D4AE|nr:hypothetical protein [Endozoicomonas sp. 4G]
MSVSVPPLAANGSVVKNKTNATILAILLIFKLSQIFYFAAVAGYNWLLRQPDQFFGLAEIIVDQGGLFAI